MAKKTNSAGIGSAKEQVATQRDYDILRRPIITEKSGSSGASAVFEVQVATTKTEIKAAIERIFKVDVTKVRTANLLGKVKRTRGKQSQGRRASFKKAYITLGEGQVLDFVEGV